jgi:tRNA (mo5U34)-methyltransferase
MRGAGAKLVIGLDPVMLYVLQHQVMQRYLNDSQHHVLPLRGEDLPADLTCFDTVFSMGVLYHRKAPFDHLFELRGALKPGGELVLETLVVEGDADTVFTPSGRYARMRNVWFVPSVAALEIWLQRCGFTDIKCVDVNRTSVEEQRATEWMIEESLAAFLDKKDPSKTMEGHPAPLRAVVVATRA